MKTKMIVADNIVYFEQYEELSTAVISSRGYVEKEGKVIPFVVENDIVCHNHFSFHVCVGTIIFNYCFKIVARFNFTNVSDEDSSYISTFIKVTFSKNPTINEPTPFTITTHLIAISKFK